jgi:glycosyltransferase involved in cell wall biosynthesis
MRAIFVHDHRFVVRAQVHSTVYPYDTWRRYLQVFDELTVLGRRADDEPGTGSLSVSSGPGVRFHFGEGLASLASLLRLGGRENGHITRLIAEHDAVIARLPSEYGLAAVGAARTLRKACLVEVVGCARDAYWNYGSVAAKLYTPVAVARMRKAVGAADFVSYVTESFLQRRYPAKAGAVTAAISNVEIEDLPASVLAARLRRIRASEGRVVFGLIGSLKTRYKGVQTAIVALGGLDRAGRDFELRVLGGGDTSAYQRLAERTGIGGRVSFDGTLPGGRAVWKWLDGVDVYLQPSLQEGLPRALIEAMSRACPAVASSAGGIPELLDRGSMFPPGDAPAMAELIRTQALDPAWREAQAARNFEAAGRYTRTVLNRERGELLRALVDAV